MKMKKFLSIFLAVIFAVTSTVNCFAVGPDSDSDAGDTGSPSDIVIPALISQGNLEERLAHIDGNIQAARQLREDFKVSDDVIAAVDAACDRYDSELNRVNEILRQTIRERDDDRLQLRMAEDALKEYGDDVMCTCLQRNPSGELIPLVGNPIVPRSCILRSKKFYKGMLTGAIIVAAVLIGMYVYVYYIHAPAKSE